MVLNGINYTEKHLTDEEMAVVEAMRMGADIQANIFHSSENAAREHGMALSLKMFPDRNMHVLDTGTTCIRFDGKGISIVHYVSAKKSRRVGSEA